MKRLKTHDLVCVHVEAPDEASHEGNVDEKVKALEPSTSTSSGRCSPRLPGYGEWRDSGVAGPSHAAQDAGFHAYGMVPFAVAGTGV